VSKRIGIDVGGTFTDIIAYDEQTGTIQVGKVPSTPDPMDGVMAGVLELGIELSATTFFAHGTTVATNALITRSFPRAAMVTTRGFRDILEMRRGNREDIWDTYADVAPPYIRRRDRLEITERISHAGEILSPLSENEARDLAETLRCRDIRTIAVCFMNAHANTAHEKRMIEILREELPEAHLICSSDVLHEIFEHERFSTTVVNAVLMPLIDGYIDRLDARLKKAGYPGDLLLLHSGGGVMTAESARQLPARLAASGLSAGTIASRHIAQLAGSENAIGLDMGGTSTDVSLVYQGEARMTKEWAVDFGYPICFPSVEVLTIGAGGGSLAWIDDAGSLRNGPQSAGATPGPACYAHGNDIPTNTDANLVLGRLGDQLLEGAMKLDTSRAVAAIEKHIATPLGMSVQAAAYAIISVANGNMADAVRRISIRRGYDPREFTLVVFGGAGPLHGVELARELDIPQIIVPPNPGITSALGCLLVDLQHDLSTSFFVAFDALNMLDLEAEFSKLEEEAMTRLREEGADPERIELQRSLDMRYVGQWRSLSIPVARSLDALDIVTTFHSNYAREYMFNRESYPLEIHGIALRATGLTDKPNLPRHAPSCRRVHSSGRREVWFGTDKPINTPIFQRASLGAGAQIIGPAVIEQLDSTTVIPPDVVVEVDEWLNLRMKIEGDSQ
jgi:N-methylhydantoinase A